MSNKKIQYAKEDTTLAIKKTILSATRTLLSYFRTSVVLISLAFAFMKLDKEKPIDAFTITLFALSLVVFVIGIVDFCLSKRFARSFEPEE